MHVIAHTQSHTCTCVACCELPSVCPGVLAHGHHALSGFAWTHSDEMATPHQSCAQLWAGAKGSETANLPCKVAVGLRMSTTQRAAASPSCRAGATALLLLPGSMFSLPVSSLGRISVSLLPPAVSSVLHGLRPGHRWLHCTQPVTPSLLPTLEVSGSSATVPHLRKKG